MKKSLLSSETTWIFAILFIALIGLLVGCTNSEKKQYYNKYGAPASETDIFIDFNNNGKADKLKETASYYIGELSGDYLEAANRAIKQANEINGVSVNGKAKKGSKFSMWQFVGGNTQPAYNTLQSKKADAITDSAIFLNTSYNGSKAQKMHVVIHEMGHTLGLKDLYNPDSKSEYEKYSIMYYTFGKNVFDDYQEFDKENLKYLYE